jgi:glucose/arabinose dehydrogenase
VPVVNVVSAKGWAPGQTPVAADGALVTPLATNLEHPRWVNVLPNGDVLVAETNAPVRPKNNPGLKGRFFNHYQKKAGGAVPSANRITLLRDADGDGQAEVRTVFLKGLCSPFGMALVGDTFYVANSDALVRFPYHAGETEITAAPVKVLDLASRPRTSARASGRSTPPRARTACSPRGCETPSAWPGSKTPACSGLP